MVTGGHSFFSVAFIFKPCSGIAVNKNHVNDNNYWCHVQYQQNTSTFRQFQKSSRQQLMMDFNYNLRVTVLIHISGWSYRKHNIPMHITEFHLTGFLRVILSVFSWFQVTNNSVMFSSTISLFIISLLKVKANVAPYAWLQSLRYRGMNDELDKTRVKIKWIILHHNCDRSWNISRCIIDIPFPILVLTLYVLNYSEGT